ncbi:hypothetical protein KHQ81_01665 [Mycoplasmatota bacterium]|nr:hypothetical protein KHQ81_01665 [Mycoplasmatota bacterium]
MTAAVAITVATGGAAAPLLIGVAVSTLSGAAIEGAIGYATGGEEGLKEGLVNGASDGFMWGGIFALGSSAVSAVKVVNQARQGVTIGRNMNKVRRAAIVSETSTYKGLNSKIHNGIKKVLGKDMADDISYLHNKAWINNMMKLNANIYDNGLSGAAQAGRYYSMELRMVRNYANYIKMW